MKEEITVGNLTPAYWSAPDKGENLPAIILIHEIWGLNRNICDSADRLSAEGYAVLAPDLFSDVSFTGKVDQSILGEMQNPKTRDEAQRKMRAAFAPTQAPDFAGRMLQKLQTCFEFLHSGKELQRVAVMGFCFGGTYSFALAAEQPQLRAAIPFYGHPPEPIENAARISCPVLAFNGGRDRALIKKLPELRKVMKAAGKDFQDIVYPDAGHAFFNETNPATYQKKAAQDAWRRTLVFLAKNLR